MENRCGRRHACAPALLARRVFAGVFRYIILGRVDSQIRASDLTATLFAIDAIKAVFVTRANAKNLTRPTTRRAAIPTALRDCVLRATGSFRRAGKTRSRKSTIIGSMIGQCPCSANWRHVRLTTVRAGYSPAKHDSSFHEEFRHLLNQAGIRPVRIPPRSPNCNARFERFYGWFEGRSSTG